MQPESLLVVRVARKRTCYIIAFHPGLSFYQFYCQNSSYLARLKVLPRRYWVVPGEKDSPIYEIVSTNIIMENIHRNNFLFSWKDFMEKKIGKYSYGNCSYEYFPYSLIASTLTLIQS